MGFNGPNWSKLVLVGSKGSNFGNNHHPKYNKVELQLAPLILNGILNSQVWPTLYSIDANHFLLVTFLEYSKRLHIIRITYLQYVFWNNTGRGGLRVGAQCIMTKIFQQCPLVVCSWTNSIRLKKCTFGPLIS